jgi:hypothetical protein
MDMTYHELLEKYKNGTLEEEKYNEISEEIEKHSAISEYLFDNDEIPETDFEIVNESENETALNDFSASIKKAIRKAFIKAGAITFVFSVCVVLGIVFGLAKLVDCFYYNPSKKVSGMTDSLDLDVDVYSEMFLPFRSSVACYSESNGYGEYDVEFHEGVSFTGEISMAAGKINKNKLKMYDLSFFRHISMNSFNLPKADVGSRLASDAFEYAGGYEIDELEEKTHYNATVTFDRVYTYNEFVDFCKENDIKPRWNAVCYKDEKRENLLKSEYTICDSGIFGFRSVGSGFVYEFDEKKYPYLTSVSLVKPGNEEMFGSEEKTKQHLLSMLRYMQDDPEFFEMINGGKSDFLKKIEKSIEKDGFRIYGFAITAEKEKLQRIASIKNIADMTITKA